MVWTTLEEVYGHEDLTIDNAIQLVRRPAKLIGHNRKVLFEFRADMHIGFRAYWFPSTTNQLLKPQNCLEVCILHYMTDFIANLKHSIHLTSGPLVPSIPEENALEKLNSIRRTKVRSQKKAKKRFYRYYH